MCIYKLSYAILTFSFLWPSPWPDDLDKRSLNGYSEDVGVYQNEVSRPRLSKIKTRNKRQTDATEHITTRHSRVVMIQKDLSTICTMINNVQEALLMQGNRASTLSLKLCKMLHKCSTDCIWKGMRPVNDL